MSSGAAVRALTGADGVAPDLVEAVQPSHAVEHALLNRAGGLACSWRAGAGQASVGAVDGDWAYLSVWVLPDAAAEWVPPYAGDVPSKEHRTIADVEATTAAGETGWRISAPVGSAWVDVRVTSSGVMGGVSRFDGAPFDSVLDGMMPAAQETFTAVHAASPERLSWPTLVYREGEARCDGDLDEGGIGAALHLDGAPTTYSLRDARAEKIDGLGDAVAARIGLFTCELAAEGFGSTEITVVRGFAPTLGDLMTMPDMSSALEPVVLEGSVEPEAAARARREDGPRSPVYFALGNTLYCVSSDGATSVAEVIISQTR